MDSRGSDNFSYYSNTPQKYYSWHHTITIQWGRRRLDTPEKAEMPPIQA